MQRYNVCEIDLAAIRHNVGVMKSHIAGGAKFLAVVKADAYGHGAVPVGYADGYRRGISGKGCVLVRGKRAPILGRVCMDQMMVDVTDIPGAQVGDEVVLLGRQGDERIDAEEMAAWLDTISYEVLCSPSRRVPRVYINA